MKFPKPALRTAGCPLEGLLIRAGLRAWRGVCNDLAYRVRQGKGRGAFIHAYGFGVEFKVWDLGCKAQGLGFRV